MKNNTTITASNDKLAIAIDRIAIAVLKRGRCLFDFINSRLYLGFAPRQMQYLQICAQPVEHCGSTVVSVPVHAWRVEPMLARRNRHLSRLAGSLPRDVRA